MIYINAFIFAGLVCLIGQIILDNTKLTAGHITSLFVCMGAFLDTFSMYDRFVLWAGAGALVPITSFGHLLIHASLSKVEQYGFIGLLSGMLDLTATGIVSAIIFSFVLSLFFNSKD